MASKDIADNSLIRAMEKHYTDEQGNTVQDAVQLGIAILYFYQGIHEAKASAAEEDETNGMGMVDEFVYSITMEHFSLERFNKNRQVANVHLDNLAEKCPKASGLLREWLYSPVLDILENRIYQIPTASFGIHLLICEGGMRLYNSYIFSGMAEKKGEGFGDIAFANMQCSMHVLAFIAFIVSNSSNQYLSMNVEVEQYMYDISKKLVGK